jgi:hypothetical protein
MPIEELHNLMVHTKRIKGRSAGYFEAQQASSSQALIDDTYEMKASASTKYRYRRKIPVCYDRAASLGAGLMSMAQYQWQHLRGEILDVKTWTKGSWSIEIPDPRRVEGRSNGWSALVGGRCGRKEN